MEYGVGEFVVGQYGRFDVLAARAAQKAKERHPDVRLVYLRPYPPAERPGNARELLDYARVREKKGLIHIENVADEG